MVINIQQEFKIMLREYDWMDAISRQHANEKVENLFEQSLKSN